MTKWLESDRPKRQADYMKYLRSAVNAHRFVDAACLDSFWDWCMDNYTKEETK